MIATAATTIGPSRHSGCWVEIETPTQPATWVTRLGKNSRAPSETAPTIRVCSSMFAIESNKPDNTINGFELSETSIPVNAGSWLTIMSTAAALTKPVITGWLSKFTSPPIRESLSSHRMIPDCKQMMVVICRYSSLYLGAYSLTVAATMSAATATGPTTNCLELPNMA